MKDAVIYARYSSNNQTEQSIEGQIRVCTDYAKHHNLRIVGEYIDRAISGRTDNRPDFQRLIADADKKIFDAVIVYRTDRFARNKYDSAIYKRQLKRAGIEIHYAAENIPDGPEGIILESLMEGLAEYYSAELSQKIRRGVRESALKCHWTGGGLALGYKIGEDKSFEIDEEGAQAVWMIFDMFIKGESNAAICETLNTKGYKTCQGNPFNKNSIPRIIKNDKYIGVYKCGDVRIEGGVPAIISKDVFLLAQEELKKRRTSKQVAAPKAEYLLSGKLFCGDCKRSMVGVSGTGKSKKKWYYYYCPDARAKGSCRKRQINRDYLEDLVVEKTAEFILQPDVISYLARACYDLQIKRQKSNDTLLALERKLQKTKRAITNTIKAIETGVSTETLPLRLQELENEQRALESEISYQKNTQTVISVDQIEFFLTQYLQPSENHVEYKKYIINTFVSSVYLYDDKMLVYYNLRHRGRELDSSTIELFESPENEVFEQKSSTSTTLEKSEPNPNRGRVRIFRIYGSCQGHRQVDKKGGGPLVWWPSPLPCIYRYPCLSCRCSHASKSRFPSSLS